MAIQFCDDEHKNAYENILSKMRRTDSYHKAMAYLLSLDIVLRDHISEVFNFEEDVIIREGLHKGFQTGTSVRTTRLAFNLWNGCYDDGETYIGEDGSKKALPSYYYTPDFIFCNSYAPFYFEAIKLRYPQYTTNNFYPR